MYEITNKTDKNIRNITLVFEIEHNGAIIRKQESLDILIELGRGDTSTIQIPTYDFIKKVNKFEEDFFSTYSDEEEFYEKYNVKLVEILFDIKE